MQLSQCLHIVHTIISVSTYRAHHYLSVYISCTPLSQRLHIVYTIISMSTYRAHHYLRVYISRTPLSQCLHIVHTIISVSTYRAHHYLSVYISCTPLSQCLHIVHTIICFARLFSSLFVPKDQINPVMESLRYERTLKGFAVLSDKILRIYRSKIV